MKFLGVRILYTHAWVWMYSVPFVRISRFVQGTVELNIFHPLVNFPVASPDPFSLAFSECDPLPEPSLYSCLG